MHSTRPLGPPCRCCGSAKDAATIARAGKCLYCAQQARVGGCLGVHGDALRWHLDQQVADGFWTRELAEWWLKVDAQRIGASVRRGHEG